ncbi:MAG: gamma-glutamyl-gamma-aminobutyrate hydrolase family protein [Pseudomonadales bacterium]
MNNTRKPVIGIICDAFGRDGKPDRLFHGVAEEYIRAIADGTNCTPVLIPVSTNGEFDVEAYSQLIDGLLLTGSRTNVHPDRYSGQASKPGTLHDLKRDISSFTLIEKALETRLPVFGICRGFQEINVALGGTLHQELTDIEGKQDHARFLSLPQPEQYKDSHKISLTENGLLHRLTGQLRISINSLHHQGIDRLADTLVLEGIADDDTPEAFRLADPAHFFLAVQWHPEWHLKTDPVSRVLFNAFGEAVKKYAANA